MDSYIAWFFRDVLQACCVAEHLTGFSVWSFWEVGLMCFHEARLVTSDLKQLCHGNNFPWLKRSWSGERRWGKEGLLACSLTKNLERFCDINDTYNDSMIDQKSWPPLDLNPHRCTPWKIFFQARPDAATESEKVRETWLGSFETWWVVL